MAARYRSSTTIDCDRRVGAFLQCCGAAAQEVTFVPGNARCADYRLTIWASPAAAGNVERLGTVGSTPVGGGRRVTNEGRVYVDRLITGATRDTVGRILFGLSPNFLGYGLGTAGAHEIGHFLLQQNFDSSEIRGLMTARFPALQWFGAVRTFTAAQIERLNQRCVLPTSTLPVNSITIRQLQPIRRLVLGATNFFSPPWMQDFLDWIGSIGRDPEVIITACAGGDCPPMD